MRAAVDAHMYACRIPAGVHLHRVRWTIAYYERACPQLLASIGMHTFFGLDETNLPFMIMPRRAMDVLRMLMLADSLTLRQYHKTTAVYPLLLRLYLTERLAPCDPSDPFAHVDLNALATMCVGHVLGYWLSVPAPPGGAFFVRDGMPGVTAEPSAFCALHSVVYALALDGITRTGAANYSLVSSFADLSAVRSYLMINATHTLSAASCNMLAASRHDVAPHLRQALAAMRGLSVPRGPGRPRKATAAPTSDRVSTRIVSTPDFAAALAAAAPDNPLLSCPIGERVALLNHWVYIAALAAPTAAIAAQLLRDFQPAGIEPLAMSDYQRNKYSSPPNVSEPWAQSNEWFIAAGAECYSNFEWTLRPTCARSDMSHLVRFLQQLEHFVCASDVARHGVRMRPADDSLVGVLTRLYAAPEHIPEAMPIASYFHRGDNRHHLTTYEGAMCIADVLPASTTAASGGVNPVTCIMNTGDSSLSDVAADLVTMFASALDEQQIINPDLEQRLFRDALACAATLPRARGLPP
jgi:hypothetical protein